MRLPRAYTAENVVAEHISPPLSEDIKVTLKVSQNLHATMTPFILGEALAHKTKDIDQAGFDLERDFLIEGWAGFERSIARRRRGRGAVGIFHAGFHGALSGVHVAAEGFLDI